VSAAVVAAACLAVAGGWRAWLIRGDVHHIREAQAARAYRPDLGWTDSDQLALRLRWSWVGFVASAALVLAIVVGRSAPVLWPACSAVIASWVVCDARLDYGRYMGLCIVTLAVSVALAGVWLDAGGLLASVAAAQMYLVSGIRKLRAPDFMSGRVVLDNLAYAACQATAGNRDFVRTISPARLADLLERGTLLRLCRAAAIATAAAELAIAVGAIGLLPASITFALAVPMHLGFMLLLPRRLPSFTMASLGLLALATVNPILGGA
jgi:hypothetical protein